MISKTHQKLQLEAYHYRLASLLLLGAHILGAKVLGYSFEAFKDGLFAINIFILCAVGVCFILLTEANDNARQASLADLWFLLAVVCTLVVTSLFGWSFDIGLALTIAAGYFWFNKNKGQNDWFIGLILCALAINILWAPALYQVIKSPFLAIESTLITNIASLAGMPLTADGVFITHADGMRLVLVAGCSIYNNLAVAFLVYATIKGLFRSPPSKHDVWFVLVLIAVFVVGNAWRLAAMSPSFEAYEYWHHGQGEFIIRVSQLVVTISLCLIFVRKGKTQ